MKPKLNQAGFSVVELVIIVLVVAIIGLVGYKVSGRQSDTSTSNQPLTASVSTAPTISSTNDLDKAAATLDQNDPDSTNSSDTSQLDAELSSF